MPKLPLLADPVSYRACIQDLLADGVEVREYWLRLFEEHVETLASLPLGSHPLRHEPAYPAFRADYLAGIEELRARPNLRGRLTVLELTVYRDEKLHAHGFLDPFHELKQRENALSLRLLPTLLSELDTVPPASLVELLARGLFAGNLFDMGSKAAVNSFEGAAFDFAAVRARVKPRPWPVDDLDAWTDRLKQGRPYQRCLFFVDNAGPDIILGVIPFALALANRGTQVILAANSKPALNDVTADELRMILDECCTLSRAMRDLVAAGSISVVSSGCRSPLIDLSLLSDECCTAAQGCDLLVLEGMGRAIESNYDARFTVDTLKIALIKDAMVARLLAVNLFDPVFKFERA